MVELIFKNDIADFCVCLMVKNRFFLPSQLPRFKVNGNHWTRHVKIFHPQFLSDNPSIVRHFKKISIFPSNGEFLDAKGHFLVSTTDISINLMVFQNSQKHDFFVNSQIFQPMHLLNWNFSIFDEKRYWSHMWCLKNRCSRQQKLFQREKNGPQKYWSADNVEKWNKLYPNIWSQHRILQIYHFRTIHNV